MTTFVFVRHGETEATKHGIFSGGKTDAVLTEEGLLTTKAFIKRLLDSDAIIDACITSRLQRAKAFAYYYKEMFEGPIFFDPRLNEKDAGVFEGCSAADYHSLNFEEQHVDRWLQPLPEGESHKQVFDRVFESLLFWSKQYPTGRILIGSHTDVIRAVEGVASKMSHELKSLLEGPRNAIWPSDEDLTKPIPHFYTYECTLTC